jgi:hypothetical protein
MTPTIYLKNTQTSPLANTWDEGDFDSADGHHLRTAEDTLTISNTSPERAEFALDRSREFLNGGDSRVLTIVAGDHDLDLYSSEGHAAPFVTLKLTKKGDT